MKRNFDLKKRMCAAALLLLLCGYGSAYAGTEKMPGVTSASPQQSGKVTCVVSDEFGPVAGVNVVVKGTTNGNITDADGKVTLENLGSGAVLVVSYIGYMTQEIAVNGQTIINVTIKEDTQKLDEVVVVGYGVQRKRDIAGSISSISSKDLDIKSVNNIQDLLQGRLSGVSVSTSGVAGEAPVIRIRGIGTLSNNNPLYVIDGIPTKSDDAAQINPSNIENIQVLKDAASASIYGAQASNGVILITTKQGKAGADGKPSFNVSVNQGVQRPTNLPEVLTPQQYADVLWNAMKNAGLTPSHAQFGSGSTPVIPEYIVPAGASSVDLSSYNTGENQYMKANKAGTNWFDEIFRLANTTTVDLNASGGTKRSKYFMGANYQTQDALVRYAGYDRFSVRGNSSFEIMKGVTLGSNMSARYSKYHGGTTNADAALIPSIIPVKDVMGNWAGTKANGLSDATNPVADLYGQKDNYNKTINFLGNLFLDVNFLRYFNFKTNVGINYVDGEGKSFSPTTYWNKGDKNTITNGLSVSRQKTSEVVWNNTLNFTKDFNNHRLNVLLGTEAISYNYNYLSANRNKFAVDNVDYRYLSAGESNITNAETASAYSLFSIFGRVNYQYKDKYYLSGVIRRDGSSRFSDKNKYGYFPGISAAWRITGESFMQDQRLFSDLKLRASYGVTGNQEIGNYAFASTYYIDSSTTSYPIQGDPNSLSKGIALESIGNNGIKWETTTMTDIGLDVGLFDNSLNLTFDYYHKYTKDILQQVTYPATAGVAYSPYENIGEMQNNGWEVGVNYFGKSSGDFRYELGVLVSGYKNEVKKLADHQFISGSYSRTEEGHPIGAFYGYQIDGIFQTQEEVDNHAEQTDKAIGRWKFRDVNNDGKINSDDRTYIGNPHPDFEYSINGRFYYKNFDLTMFFQGTVGNDICFASKSGKNSIDFWTDYFNKSTRILDTWSETNRDAKLPQINILNPNNEANEVTSYLIEDGSYLRLKNIELGYTIPASKMQKLNLGDLRVYFNAENLFTLTKYNNMDPEVRSTDDKNMGVDDINSMPIAKIFSVGFNLAF